MNTPHSSDLSRLKGMTDEEALLNAIADEDSKPLGLSALVRSLKVDLKKPKEQITLRLDADVLAWFKAKGKGYQSYINAVLKAYKEANAVRHKEAVKA